MKWTLSIDLDHINTQKSGSLVQKKKKKIDKFFEEHQRHLWTLKSLTGNKKKKVNYITVNKWFINTILHSETYISIDCGRDQLWVICIQRVKL